MKKLFLIGLIFITACSTPQPQMTVTALPTATDSLTSTPQPTSTPIPSPTLTFTPTAVKYSAEHLDNMTEEQKIAAAREMAGDVFGEKTIVGESVEGSVATFFSTYRTTDEYGKSVVRTYTVGGVELKTGEVIPGYTPKELPALHAEGNMPEKFYFDGELLSRVVDTESALARAQEATYRGVEYLAEIPVWKDKDGNIVLVDWPYWPGGPRELMSYSASADGKLVQLMPALIEFRLTLENLNADQVKSIFDTLMRDQKNADLLEVVNDPEGVVIAVNGLDTTTKNYWEGDEAESRNATLQHWKSYENTSAKGYTADKRNKGVVVAFRINTGNDADLWRTLATLEEGKHKTSLLVANLVTTNQDTTSFVEFERNFVQPQRVLIKMLNDFGITVVMFDTKEND